MHTEQSSEKKIADVGDAIIDLLATHRLNNLEACVLFSNMLIQVSYTLAEEDENTLYQIASQHPYLTEGFLARLKHDDLGQYATTQLNAIKKLYACDRDSDKT